MASETRADIIAEMRRRDDGNPMSVMRVAELKDYADRFEAATKMETVGDAAAMRDALVAVKKSIDGIGASSLDCDPTILMSSLTHICGRLSARIERALAKPPRNCNRFDSYKQARQEWWKTEVLPRVYGVVIGAEKPFDEWLFDIATGGVAK